MEQFFPDTPYTGCSTSGNIIDCELSGDITAAIVEETKKNPWVKAIEMFFTIPEDSTTRFSDGLKDVEPGVQIFGGVSCSDDITSDDCLVFIQDGGFSKSAVIIVFYGGEEFMMLLPNTDDTIDTLCTRVIRHSIKRKRAERTEWLWNENIRLEDFRK